MSRAVSTVLDASLCLLLVSASVVTLVEVPTAERGGRDANADADAADETAELLATTTAQVTYEAGDENRTAHDTLAGLLATAAAVASRPASDSQGISVEHFERAVTERVNRTLRRFGGDAQVVVRSGPTTRDDPPGGRVVAGRRPPPNVDVHSAVFSVSSARLTIRTWSG